MIVKPEIFDETSDFVAACVLVVEEADCVVDDTDCSVGLVWTGIWAMAFEAKPNPINKSSLIQV